MPGQPEGCSCAVSFKNSPCLCHFTDANTAARKGRGPSSAPQPRPSPGPFLCRQVSQPALGRLLPPDTCLSPLPQKGHFWPPTAPLPTKLLPQWATRYLLGFSLMGPQGGRGGDVCGAGREPQFPRWSLVEARGWSQGRGRGRGAARGGWAGGRRRHLKAALPAAPGRAPPEGGGSARGPSPAPLKPAAARPTFCAGLAPPARQGPRRPSVPATPRARSGGGGLRGPLPHAAAPFFLGQPPTPASPPSRRRLSAPVPISSSSGGVGGGSLPNRQDVPPGKAPGEWGAGLRGVGGVARPGTQTPASHPQTPLQSGQPFKFSILEICDRIKEEFQFLQAQYHR